jgi:glycerophosphoryl diester phosphodiesterase
MEIIAHRGGAKEKPENSREAIIYSLEYPFNGIEIDINFSEDNVPYIIHDGHIKNAMFDTLSSEYINKNIPNLITLKEALDLIQGKKKIFFEIKGLYSETKMEILNEIFENYGNEYNYDFYVASFNINFLINTKKNIPKMFITSNIYNIDLLHILFEKINFSAISFNYYYISTDVLSYCYLNNIKTYIWTLNNIIFFDKFNNLAKDNFLNGIITDCPSKFLNLINPQLLENFIMEKKTKKKTTKHKNTNKNKNNKIKTEIILEKKNNKNTKNKNIKVKHTKIKN